MLKEIFKGFWAILKTYFTLPYNVFMTYGESVKAFYRLEMQIDDTDTPVLKWLLVAGKGVICFLILLLVFIALFIILLYFFKMLIDTNVLQAFGILFIGPFIFILVLPLIVIMLSVFFEGIVIFVRVASDLRTIRITNTGIHESSSGNPLVSTVIFERDEKKIQPKRPSFYGEDNFDYTDPNNS